ncbi:hypothetical protein GQ53DRAFT_647468 [Thozetella sp. PMI_491]|nr:hypothetical protein GQ53DRAFT_647468 [Thozetella sp. PMI_491]
MANTSMASVDLSENRQSSLYASSTIPFALALTCVVLRFWCRLVKKTALWLDDWLILFACANAGGLMATMLWWIPRGLGKHIQTFGASVAEDFSLGLFIAELTYTGVIVFVKLSILAMYWRIVNRSTSIKLPISIMSTLVFMWGVAVFLLSLLQCIPTRGIWDKTIESSCNVDSQMFLFAISIPNILIDIALLAMPAPYVIKLNIPGKQKAAVLSVFFLGGFVCIASIMRLIAVVTEKTDVDMTWNLTNQGIWAVVEANFAIISACLPTLRPVWVALHQRCSNSKEPAPSSYKLATASPPVKYPPPSWDTLVLQSNATGGEEDTRPFAVPRDHRNI